MNSISLRVLRPLIVAAALLALWPASAFAALSYPVNAVSFYDADTGFLAGGSGSSGFVSATGDGGATWHSSIATNRFMFGVAASLDSGAAMAVGDFDGARVTSNSGSTWSAEEPLLSRVGSNIHGVAYLAGNRRVAVGGVQSPMEAAVIASAVGAGAWNINFEGPFYAPPAEDQDPPATHASLSAIDATSSGNVAWAVGNDWTLRQGFTTYQALIYKTDNAGSEWATQTVSGYHNVTSVAAADANTAFIGCASNRVLRTTDGGANWTTLASPTTVAVRAIDALDANTVVVVGDAGKIAWSTNASAATPTWTSSTIAGGNALLGVKVIDATHWVVVGDKETILRTSNGGGTWTGSTAAAAPAVTITSPTDDTLLGSTSIAASGTATDGFGVGVAKVEVRLRRADGQYWTGSAWSPSEAWLPAGSDDGWKTWEAAVLPDSSEASGAATLSARVTDGLGLVGVAKDVAALHSTAIAPNATAVTVGYNAYASIGGRLTSGGNPVAGKSVRLLTSGGSYLAAVTTNSDGRFAFAVKPASASSYVFSFSGDASYSSASSAQVKVTPKAYVGTPVVPSRVYRTKYFKAYSDLKPKHTVGSWSEKFYFERYQRLPNGKYGWARLKTVSAKAATRLSYSRCTVSVKLAKGKWRVQAMHSDTGHAVSYSGWRGFTVR